MENSDSATLDARIAALEQQVAQILDYLQAITPQPPASPRAVEPQQDKPATLEILSVNAKPTETNSVWTKWAWRVTVKSDADEAIRVQGRIQFRDSDSFALDEDVTEVLTLRPREEQVFTGYKLVDASIAGQVSSVYATLNLID